MSQFKKSDSLYTKYKWDKPKSYTTLYYMELL